MKHLKSSIHVINGFDFIVNECFQTQPSNIAHRPALSPTQWRAYGPSSGQRKLLKSHLLPVVSIPRDILSLASQQSLELLIGGDRCMWLIPSFMWKVGVSMKTLKNSVILAD